MLHQVFQFMKQEGHDCADQPKMLFFKFLNFKFLMLISHVLFARNAVGIYYYAMRRDAGKKSRKFQLLRCDEKSWNTDISKSFSHHATNRI